jgi:hypothetical protein
MSGQLHSTAALFSRKISLYPLDRRLGGPHSRSGRFEDTILDATGTRNVTPRSSSLYPFKVIGRTVPRNDCSRCLFILIFAATCCGLRWPSSGGIYNILGSYLSHNGSIRCNLSTTTALKPQQCPLKLGSQIQSLLQCFASNRIDRKY